MSKNTSPVFVANIIFFNHGKKLKITNGDVTLAIVYSLSVK